jgi:hypothetical protein
MQKESTTVEFESTNVDIERTQFDIDEFAIAKEATKVEIEIESGAKESTTQKESTKVKIEIQRGVKESTTDEINSTRFEIESRANYSTKVDIEI